MKRKKTFFLILFGLILLICFTGAEIAVRKIGYCDADGNFYFHGVKVKPFRLPLDSTGKLLEDYRSSSDSYMMYDPDLGWNCRPASQSKNRLYRYNSYGIRSAPTEYSLLPEKGTLRIMICGDSFTHCDDVKFENSWGYQLERTLQQAGIKAEVLNLGVGGYGMDQAFLRWRKLGRQFAPRIVIFGFMPDNVKRNVNLLRKMIFSSTGIPFSKPRFVETGKTLTLINTPTLRPEKLLETIKNFSGWQFAPNEFFFHTEDYENLFWRKSRFISLTGQFLEYLFQGKLSSQGRANVYFSLESEPARISLKILDTFKKEVEKTDARFLVIHLISHEYLGYLLKGEKLVYADLLAELDKRHQVIHPETDLLKAAKDSSAASLFQGHYSRKGNKLVAETITRFLQINQ